jgi:microcystin-dependent protein
MPGIPINELVSLDRPVENNDTTSYFPLVYSNGVTYKTSLKQIFYDNAVTTDVITDSAITTIKINNNAVNANKIDNNAVTTFKIEDNAVTSDKLNSTVNNEAVTTDVIKSKAVTTAKLDSTVGSEAVDTSVIRDGSITTAKLNTALFNQAVSTETIQNCAITTDKLDSTIGSEAVDTSVIRDDAITPSKIGILNNTISTNDTNILISNGNKFDSVTPTGDICIINTGDFSIKAGVVDSLEIADNAVITSKILDSNVTTDKIATDAVITSKILDSNVTTDKIADDAITTDKILDSNVTNDKIADDAITSSKILDGNVGSLELSTDSVIEIKIKDNNVTSRKIANSAVGVDQIADEAVIGSKIPDNTIDNNKINNSCDYIVNGLGITSPNLGINSVDYKFPSSATDGRFLKHNSGGNLEWVLPSSFEPQAGAVVLNKILPVGSILPYASTTLPTDGSFLPCDGTERLGTDYPELSALISGVYGTASTNGKFKLPDLSGRIPIGNDTGNDGTDSCAFTLGGIGGEYNHQLSIGEMPQHCHNYTSPIDLSQPNNAGGGHAIGAPYANHSVWSIPDDDITITAGSNEPHNNIQPYVVTKYIIKAKPDQVIQYNPNITAGLSALNGLGNQTTNVDLSTTEIGLNVTDDFQFNGAGSLKISDNWVKDNLDVGKPIKYVNTHIDTTHRYQKTADVDLHVTQLDTAITLKDINSKVYITAMITAEAYTHNGVWKLFRSVLADDGINHVQTEIGSNVTSGGNNRKGIATGMYDGEDASTPNNVYIQFMDSPGAVDVNYIFKWNSDGTGANFFTLNGSRVVTNNESYEMASSNVNLVEIGG